MPASLQPARTAATPLPGHAGSKISAPLISAPLICNQHPFISIPTPFKTPIRRPLWEAAWGAVLAATDIAHLAALRRGELTSAAVNGGDPYVQGLQASMLYRALAAAACALSQAAGAEVRRRVQVLGMHAAGRSVLSLAGILLACAAARQLLVLQGRSSDLEALLDCSACKQHTIPPVYTYPTYSCALLTITQCCALFCVAYCRATCLLC